LSSQAGFLNQGATAVFVEVDGGFILETRAEQETGGGCGRGEDGIFHDGNGLIERCDTLTVIEGPGKKTRLGKLSFASHPIPAVEIRILVKDFKTSFRRKPLRAVGKPVTMRGSE